jgi:hypothetical protein
MVVGPSDTAAPWRVEVDQGWSRFTLGCATAPFVARRRHGGTVAITIRSDLVPALSAAIDEPTAVGANRAGSWSARQEGDEVVLTGPGQVRMVDSSDAECGLARTIEIEHRHLADLRRVLTDVISSPLRSPGFPMSP